MVFSKAAVHGIYMLCYLSRQGPETVTSATALAQAVGVPPEHARKILTRLCATGLVTATSGRSGGYTPARSMGDISVLDVLDAIGPVADGLGLEPRMCAAAPDEVCSVQPGLTTLWEQARELLASRTLASVAGAQCRQRTRTSRIAGCAGCGAPVDEALAAS